MPVLLAVTALRRRASAGQTALSYVLGYANSNDVSSRHWQRTCNQWVKGKSFDTFCPIGPVLCSPEASGRFCTCCAAVLTGMCLYDACSCHEITEWKPGQVVGDPDALRITSRLNGNVCQVRDARRPGVICARGL
eukprot:COSAG01_NODE_13763_length_1538_cov_2.806810_2_plen_135_part_00